MRSPSWLSKLDPILAPSNFKARTDEILDDYSDQSQRPSKGSVDKQADLLDAYEYRQLGERVERQWRAEEDRVGAEQASLCRVLFSTLASDFLCILALACVTHILATITLLESFRQLLSALSLYDELKSSLDLESQLANSTHAHQPADDALSATYERVCAWTAVLLVCLPAFCVSWALRCCRSELCAVKCRICLTYLIQRKSTSLHMNIVSSQSGSQALSLMSDEVNAVEASVSFIVYLLVGPLALLASSSWLAATQLGLLPLLATLPVLVAYYLLKVATSGRYARAIDERLKATNCLNELMADLLAAIKVVKLYAWESRFKALIGQAAAVDRRRSAWVDLLDTFDLVALESASKVLPLIITMVLIVRQHGLQPNVIFTTHLAYYLTCIVGLLFFFRSICGASNMVSSCNRIKEYLQLPEKANDLEASESLAPGELVCDHLSADFSAETPATVALISDLNLHARRGDLVMVVGRVGAGKSCLLLSLLGETHLLSGRIQLARTSKIAYAPQDPWILSASLRDNILLGRPMDEKLFARVISACCLQTDISQLEFGERTRIGARGLNLSGGQRARLNLARALYAQADVYLLDDPLSAVDAQVANSIFAHAIRGLLRDRLVVLVTHQVRFLPEASQVVVLERGKQPLVSTAELVLSEFSDLSLAGEQQEREHDKVAATDQLERVELGSARQEHQADLQTFRFFLALAGSTWNSLTIVLALVLTILATAAIYLFRQLWAQQLADERGSEYEHAIHYWLTFLVLVLVQASANFCFLSLFSRRLSRCNGELHDRLMESLMSARMSFYDRCEPGELSSRYAGDVGALNSKLAFYSSFCLAYSTWCLAAVLVLVWTKPLLGFIAIALVLALFGSSADRTKLSRLKRITRSLASDVNTGLASMLDDLLAARSDANNIEFIANRFIDTLDGHTSLSVLCIRFQAAQDVSTYLLANAASALILLLVVGFQLDTMSSADVAVIIAAIIDLSFICPQWMTFVAEAKNCMTSVGSIRQFLSIEPERQTCIIGGRSVRVSAQLEANETQPTGESCKQLIGKWPSGRISFVEVSLNYSRAAQPLRPPALDRLTICIEAGERVGVVGRTGAGKSSILSCLFRLYPIEGTICIDGVDIHLLEVQELRKSLAVIPQDPVLLSDTLRANLDPSASHSDEQIWRALQVCSLADFVRTQLPNKLDERIQSAGKKLSVGERQLVCLCRALLKQPKVLLLDEATANVDRQTDELIQATIAKELKDCTLITVAHRLNTLLNYDKILVLDQGRAVEFDTVERLMGKQDGHFRRMLESSKGR